MMQFLKGQKPWNNNTKKIAWSECKNCGRKFSLTLTDKNRGRGSFCSQKCAQDFMKKKNHPCWKGRYVLICPVCNASFLVPLGRVKTRITCSKQCYKIHLSKKLSGDVTHLWKGGKSREPYPIKFNNYLKEKIRKRDQYRCRVCEKSYTRKLDIHHIDYDKDNLSENNLISLCRSCHRKTNFKREYWKHNLTLLISHD